MPERKPKLFTRLPHFPKCMLGAILLFSLAGQLAAQNSLTSAISTADQKISPYVAQIIGYFDTSYELFSIEQRRRNQTSQDGNLGGAIAVPVTPYSDAQFDADWARVFPPNCGPSFNVVDFDVHYIERLDTTRIGGILGVLSNDGNSTWGGGIEMLNPIPNLIQVNPFGWAGWNPGPQGFDQTLFINSAVLFAHTSDTNTDLFGGRVGFGWTPAPCCQFNANFGLQHSSEKFFTGLTRSDTTFSWDVSAEVRVLETP